MVKRGQGQEARRFNLQEELRATADRRKRPASTGSGFSQGGPSIEGIPSIADRLSVMFPTLPRETVHAVLSELFRADAGCSRDQLAVRAVAALQEMCSMDGSPTSITSFEPVFTGKPASDDLSVVVPTADEEQALQETALLPEESGVDDYSVMALLDEGLAELLSLSQDELKRCFGTLSALLGRIAAEPANDRVRRVRIANSKFDAAVGKHPAAVDLLHLAGFCTDGDGVDCSLIFRGDPSDPNFSLVHEAIRRIAGDLEESSAQTPPSAQSANRDMPSSAKIDMRRRIAELTEQRLRDPNGFRQRSEARSSGNVGVGGRIRSHLRSLDGGKPDRRSKHFSLADIDRMRINDEIANTPSYAEEYRQQFQSGPARNYSTLVSRSYDPDLISRQALDGTNRYRASKGLAPCRWHDGIARIAAEHARQMASGEAPFSHDGFHARVQAFPISHRSAAENLALNQGVSDVAQAAVDGWIKSPGHEKNLRGAFNFCGIGTARSANGTFYLTQLFALAA